MSRRIKAFSDVQLAAVAERVGVSSTWRDPEAAKDVDARSVEDVVVAISRANPYP
jgi:hypothetical protein